ncbi:MAG TPA: hypothetical protein VH915_15005, partial [Pedococcus sp.]
MSGAREHTGVAKAPAGDAQVPAGNAQVPAGDAKTPEGEGQGRAGGAQQPGRPTLSCVVLTRGDRPAELARALESLRSQQGEPVETVVVGNGVEVDGLPGWVR